MVCFVVLHYIAEDETKQCISSILNNVEGEKKIIIVDNASPNGSGEVLRKFYALDNRVDVILNKNNDGFAKGNNIGYYHAKINYNPDFIVVMNNDMEIQQREFLKEIYECYDKYKFAVMGPDIYSTKAKRHQNPESEFNITLDNLKKRKKYLLLKKNLRFIIRFKWMLLRGKKKFSNINDEENNFVDHVVEDKTLHGSCYILSRDFIEQREKCFYDKTFMYMESYILTYEMKRDNMKMIYYPNVKILHHEDVSTDRTYTQQYKKSFFTIDCLLQSCNAFIELIEKDIKKNETK